MLDSDSDCVKQLSKMFLKIFYFNVVATVKVGNAVSLTGDTTHTGVFD